MALLHTIGRLAPPGPTSPWLSRHVFPGAHVPALSEILRPIEALQLELCDVEVW